MNPGRDHEAEKSVSQFFMSFETNGFMRHLNHGINARSPPAACRLPCNSATYSFLDRSEPRIIPTCGFRTLRHRAAISSLLRRPLVG